MENIFARTNRTNAPQSQQIFTLQNLSPQKYGKAAYANLTYSPSKLADNILYRDFSNKKQQQQSASKLRQTQIQRSIILDRLNELALQKQGIQKNLNDQIFMYKKMLKEKQEKNEKRIKALQESFKAQVKKSIEQKQVQAKFWQAEKEQYQKAINNLQSTIDDLKDKLAYSSDNYESLNQQNSNLKAQNKNLNEKLIQKQSLIKANQLQYRQQIDALKNKIYENAIQAQKQLEKQLEAKDQEFQNAAKVHRNQVERIESNRAQELALKNQEIKNIAGTFQKELVRLNSILNQKDDKIAKLMKALQVEKQRNQGAEKKNQIEIVTLSNEKSRLKQDLIKAQRKLQKMTAEYEQIQTQLRQIKSQSQSQINTLKKNLQVNQIHFIQQLQQKDHSLQQLTKQLVQLKLDNQQVEPLLIQTKQMNQEMTLMKELLIQSQAQMQRCKQEYLKINREKQFLVIKLKEIGWENDALYRIKNQRVEQAKCWRDNYYMSQQNKRF